MLTIFGTAREVQGIDTCTWYWYGYLVSIDTGTRVGYWYWYGTTTTVEKNFEDENI